MRDNLSWTPVIVESPYSGDKPRNAAYLDACMRDCVSRGESPYASHKLMHGVLDDDLPIERDIGISAGFAWRGLATHTVFYTDYSMSSGMLRAFDDCVRKELPMYVRLIYRLHVRIDNNAFAIETEAERSAVISLMKVHDLTSLPVFKGKRSTTDVLCAI